MIWQISKPGNGAADFEFWTNEQSYATVKQGAGEALSISAAQASPKLS